MIVLASNYWTLPLNPNNESVYARTLNVHYENNSHEDIVGSVYPPLIGIFSFNTDVHISNNTYTRVSGRRGIMTIDRAQQVYLDSVTYSNSSDFGTNICRFFMVDYVSVSNLEILNVEGTGSFSDFYLFFLLNHNGEVKIDYLTFIGNDIGPQWGIYIGGIVKKLSITNSEFRDSKVGDSNSLISTGTFKSLEIRNVIFSSIMDSVQGNQDNDMLSLDTIYLKDASDSIINNITVENSRVGFLTVNNIAGETNKQIRLEISDIVYKDWEFKFKEKLILFSQMETQQDIMILIDGITFQNMRFEAGGYLILFEQQIFNPIHIKNFLMTDIFAGYITLESANKQNLENKTKVRIENSLFEVIDSNYDSMIYNYEGGFLEIYNSTFNQISCLEEGAIIYAGYRNTVTNIYGSTFTNNSAVDGALFNIEEGSVIRLYN